jgi:hypothetical protein
MQERGDEMKEFIETAMFCGIFAVLFIVGGARWLLAARSEDVVRSIFRGSTGIALGLGFSFGA